MHVDISRATFDAAKHFSSVIFQQGRVALDADADEQSAILMHYLRTAIADIVGPAACPYGAPGFGITLSMVDRVPDLKITPGRMYVDGLLVEASDSDGLTYWTQPDGYLDPDQEPLPSKQAYVVYLRVFECAITAVQEPSIREIALGGYGPDTSARTKVVWQLAVLESLEGNSKAAAKYFYAWQESLYSPRGMLQAQARRPAAADLDVCDVSPSSQYRGPENQLYRVEIHNSGTASTPTAKQNGAKAGQPASTSAASFVWSRENGSVVFPIHAISGADVTLTSLGRDDKQGLEIGSWVELVDDASVSRAAHDAPASATPPLFQVISIDVPGRIVTLSDDPANNASTAVTGTNPALHPLLRRWDHRAAKGSGTNPVVEDVWLDLEDGVQVMFPGSKVEDSPNQYRRADYWLIPARTISGDVLWPQDNLGPSAQPPHGVQYHHVPLAHIAADGKTVTDLRVPAFKPQFP